MLCFWEKWERYVPGWNYNFICFMSHGVTFSVMKAVVVIPFYFTQWVESFQTALLIFWKCWPKIIILSFSASMLILHTCLWVEQNECSGGISCCWSSLCDIFMVNMGAKTLYILKQIFGSRFLFSLAISTWGDSTVGNHRVISALTFWSTEINVQLRLQLVETKMNGSVW